MSLKAFHLFFIFVSTVFAIGFGLWAILDYRSSGDVLYLAMGIFSLLGSLGLVWYGTWFFKKYKKLGYL